MCERPEICHGPVRPGTQVGAARLPRLVQRRVLGEHERARADEAHVALQDVEQLRRLVEREAPDEAPDARDALVVRALDDRAVLAYEHGRVELHRAELVELEEAPAAPGALLREEHGPARSSRIATAISARSGESTSSADRRADDVQAALGGPREARERRLADRHQRHAADLLVRARLEELEQPRDDVHGHARVAADADRVQQILVGGARERDHHAIHAAEGDQVGERVQRAEPRDAEAAGLVRRRRRCSRRGPARAPGGASGAARAAGRRRPIRG